MAANQPNFDIIRQALGEELPKINNYLPDMEGLVGAINQLRDELKADNAALKDELKADNAALKDELMADNATLKDELMADNAALKDELKGEVGGEKDEVTELRNDVEDLRTDIDELTNKTGGLEKRMKTADYNSTARTQNSFVHTATGRLTALRNPVTGEDIPNFPQTPRQIDRIPVTSADIVLQQLGLSTDGTLEAKQDRIKFAIGM